MDERIEILLAEDNAQDAEMTIRALRRGNVGHPLHWAKDGAEALDFVFARRERPPRLVLLDIKMPRVDGIEVLRRLKGDAATRAIPVVVMTSSNEERDVIETYRLGVNSYVVKPVQFDAFLDTVAKLGLYWMQLNRAPH